MSRMKNATIAAVCALGASAAMVAPASAAGTGKATYNCGMYGNPVTFTFARTATTALTVTASISYFAPVPIPVNGIQMVLHAPPAPPYPISGVSNTVAVAPGPQSTITARKSTTPPLPGPPASITITIAPPGITISCALKATPPPSGWPI